MYRSIFSREEVMHEYNLYSRRKYLRVNTKGVQKLSARNLIANFSKKEGKTLLRVR
jgi:hypothetical protein